MCRTELHVSACVTFPFAVFAWSCLLSSFTQWPQGEGPGAGKVDASSGTSAAVVVPTTDHDSIATIHRLKIRLFFDRNPALWLLQVESQFFIQRIMSKRSHFHHVVLALQPDIAVQILHLLLHPADSPYTWLKEDQAHVHLRSTAYPGTTFWWRAWRPKAPAPTSLSYQPVGDTPVNSVFLKELFVQRLRQQCHLVLETSRDSDLEHFAHQADRIMEVMPPPVHAVQEPTQMWLPYEFSYVWKTWEDEKSVLSACSHLVVRWFLQSTFLT